uniref:Uncharacterized protein n=1 Tax=Anguilla anguilla TaxID=7936 RepID=A0A0E9PQY0_ANGAN
MSIQNYDLPLELCVTMSKGKCYCPYNRPLNVQS